MRSALVMLFASSFVAAATTTTYADTLKLVSTSSQAVDGDYVYPYNFSVNGSSANISLMCMNYNREVSVGEQWNVATMNVGNYSGANATQYRAEAWLFSQLGAQPNSDVQFAAWDIFDDADVHSLSGYNANAQSLVSQANAAANNSALMASGFFSHYQIYVPTSNTAGWTNGKEPQEFIGTAVTPEPASFALLGTGLFGAAGVLRRRVRG